MSAEAQLPPEWHIRMVALLEELARIADFATGADLARNGGAGVRTEPRVDPWQATDSNTMRLLPANGNRKGATIYNDTALTLFVKLGPNASANDFSVKLGAGDYYELPRDYRGQVTAAWSAAGAGEARVTEFGW
jgi:hypothetical protein